MNNSNIYLILMYNEFYIEIGYRDMKIYLEKVKKEEKDILYRLLQYSLFEESLTDLNEMNNDALFEYKFFDKYFEENSREAYFVKDIKSNKLLGFVMINQYMKIFSNGHSIAEFMIIPKYRRQGIGKKVAFSCFSKYKGNWEVSPSFGNKIAYLFWKNVIEDYTNNNYEINDEVLTFINK